MIGPDCNEWPEGTIAWCQRCDRPIMHGRPYETVRRDGSSQDGFNHRYCPPRLVR